MLSTHYVIMKTYYEDLRNDPVKLFTFTKMSVASLEARRYPPSFMDKSLFAACEITELNYSCVSDGVPSECPRQ